MTVVKREMRSLKQVIRNLEEELLRQKSAHFRALDKRSHEHRAMLEEAYRFFILISFFIFINATSGFLQI